MTGGGVDLATLEAALADTNGVGMVRWDARQALIDAAPALLAIARAAADVLDDAGIESDDPRLKYMVIQVGHAEWSALRAALAEMKNP